MVEISIPNQQLNALGSARSKYFWLPVLYLLLSVGSVQAFEFDGKKWLGAETEFFVSLEGISGTGILWHTAFIQALNDWNEATDFHFILREEARDPCLLDSENGVDFTDDVCGSEFSQGTLAVTLTYTRAQILGPPRLIETDIVINKNTPLDIFDGRLVQFGRSFDGVDFRRVALHELGHALGLGHENSALAIMAPNVSNLDRLTDDDIASVNTLYGGLDACEFQALSYGRVSGSLTAGDCLVDELTVGGSDDSFIDVYSFELEHTTTLQFDALSTDLDSVLILADAKLQFLRFDDKQSGSCSSTLSQTLNPGSYLLLANTFVEPVQEACGNTGAYELTVAFSSAEVQSLGFNTSLKGGSSNARFSAGITADKGSSFGNRFSASDALDLDLSIDIDPLHVGQPGFLLIAAIVDGELLLLNQQGQFVAHSQNSTQFTRAASNTLSATEELTILSDFVPAEVGIDSIDAEFFFAYGLDSDPGEVYYHQTPLNLIIVP
jgi:hypothetical protein